MPELPEVEVLRRSLESGLVGRRIAQIRVRQPALRERVNAPTLRRRCLRQRIEGLRRRAKYLLIDLQGNGTLVLHLGMSGRVTIAEAHEKPERHEHLTFYLDDGRKLRFRDPRRFGLVFAVASDRLELDRHFVSLGVEPLGNGFSGVVLRAAARGRRGPVKGFLMNASIVVGLGNIYACEALYRAAIHPARSVARIAPRRWELLADASVEVLQEAIRQGGTTLNDFTNADGRSGYFQVSLSVYGREGEHCERCGHVIRRVVQGGRGTFYCPGCQR